ncbi:MAG TPA: hypothetical protein ENI23_05430 [bacterium]|nr:hypothetical protein [bacterium]
MSLTNAVKLPSGDVNFVTKFDEVPGFWQFINGLRSDDIITELLQNELDAEAEQTRILFTEDKLICEGNGKPVDEEGWQRLSFMRGAGDLAPRKQNRIGIKNHGLKTCFTIGDEIIIKSAGKYLCQTLYKNGSNNPPSPGAFDTPLLDPEAPETGCHIIVPYRLKNLVTKVGEPLTFLATSSEKIERLFQIVSKEIPYLLIGVLRPTIRERYTVILEHHLLGRVRFEFKCGRPIIKNRMKMFSRICEVYNEKGEKKEAIRERAYIFIVPFQSDTFREIPDFYKGRNGFYADIGWKTNTRGGPDSSIGHLRYPITYLSDTPAARSRLGVHYSAPYISDLTRHGTSETSDAFNQHVSKHLDERLIKILRRNLVPRFGPRSLSLLVDSSGHEDQRLKEMVESLLNHSAIPLAPKIVRVKGRNHIKGKPHQPRIRFGPLQIKNSGGKRIVLPCYTWDQNKISPLLLKLCPKDEVQIHPSTPKEIVSVLANSTCEGWKENHITFDEEDVIERLQASLDGYFPWQDEKSWKVELGNPEIVNNYLDVLLAKLKLDKEFKSDNIENLKKNMYLPDVYGNATPYFTLYSATDLPTDLPNVKMPPILHYKATDHPLFKLRTWKLQRYQFHNFLQDSNLEHANEATRNELWKWVRKNYSKVPKKNWPRLAQLPIWPDSNGQLLPLNKLCYPKQSKIRTILSDALHIPSTEVLKLPVVKRKGRSSLKLRVQPSQDEITVYFLNRLSSFPLDRNLTMKERIRFHAFEDDIEEIIRDKKIAQKLETLSSKALSLNRDGFLLSCSELHRDNKNTKRVCLLRKDIIDRSAKKVDKVFPPRYQPSLSAIVRALKQNPERIDALPSRLGAYHKAFLRGEEQTEEISEIICIPLNDSIKAPSELAFKSNKGDYWGSWKNQLSGKGLSAEVQALYRRVGVTSAEPTPQSSREFFEWLNEQDNQIIVQHLDRIIRHFNHRNGILFWCPEYPSIPCLPIEHNNGIRLVTWQVATNQRGPVFLPDFQELAEAIRISDFNSRILLAIVSVSNVRKPISEMLKANGVRSLRKYASQPLKVYGEKENQGPTYLLELLERFRSLKLARELKKRLAELDVNMDFLRSNWQNRLEQIHSLKLASSIYATYKIGRRYYNVPVNGSFCQNTGILWLSNNEKDLESLFYNTLANRVFVNDAPKWVAAALRHTLQSKFIEKRWVIQDKDDEVQEPYEPDEFEAQNDTQEHFEPDDPGETMITHKGNEPDFTKNVPKPGPIPSVDFGKKGHIIDKLPDKKRPTEKQFEEKFSPEIEKSQIKDLKENQYAWHCQICLAERTPAELAPNGSYVELQENRNKLIEAQHADQRHAKGARHAGNILILCHFHHHRYGNAISRADVTQGLRSRITIRDLIFSTGPADPITSRRIYGQVATVKIPHTDEKVKFFFTNDHKDYWLKKAEE